VREPIGVVLERRKLERGNNEIGISFFPGMVGRRGEAWEPVRPSCFGGWVNLPDTPHRLPLLQAAFRRP
jgi:hypothetical protein